MELVSEGMRKVERLHSQPDLNNLLLLLSRKAQFNFLVFSFRSAREGSEVCCCSCNEIM